jgi:MFS family permease
MFGLPAVVAAWIVFGLAHTLVRIGQPSPLADVDSLSMMAAQSFSIAYQVGQPPLYDWTLWLVQQLTGPTAFSAFLTKYAFVTAAGAFVYCGALAISGSRRVAALASISLMLLFNVGFSLHDLSTHSVALIAALAATFYFFTMIAMRGAWWDYIGLGLTLAAGTLSKHGFLILPTAFALAFLYSPSLRGRILSWRFTAAVALAAVLVAPFAAWLVAHSHDFVLKIDVSLIEGGTKSHLQRALTGMMVLFTKLVRYCLPIMPLLWLIFPQLLRRGLNLERVRAGSLADVLGLTLLIGVSIAVGLIALTGVSRLEARYMHVLVFLLPVYALLYLREDEAKAARAAVLVAIIVAAQGALLLQRALAPFFPAWPFCTDCEFLKPIDRLAEDLSARNLTRAIIWVEHDLRLGGNLRHYMPKAQVRTRHLWAKALPRRDGVEPCIMLVEQSDASPPIQISFPPAPNGYGDYASPAETIIMRWRGHDERSTTWILQPLRLDDPRCRDSVDW